MPQNCWDCPMLNGSDECCLLTEAQHDSYEGEMDQVQAAFCPLRPTPEWINVEERLPDGSEGDWVLGVAYGKRHVGAVVTVSFDQKDREWFLDDNPDEKITVTHWMPLPSPPE